MTKKKSNSKALAKVNVGEFAIMKIKPDEVSGILTDNIGPGGITALDLDRIKIPAGGQQAWSIPSLDEEDEIAKQFEGVVIFHKHGRVFWEKGIDEGSGNMPPDCWSDDAIVGIGNPCAEGATKSDRGGFICKSCPNAQFGRDENNASTPQACKEVWLLFLIRKADRIPIVVSLPPTSLKNCRRFMLRLTNAGVKHHAIVTRFGLEQATNRAGIKYARVTMTPAGTLKPKEAEFFAAIATAFKPHLTAVRVGAEDYQVNAEEV